LSSALIKAKRGNRIAMANYTEVATANSSHFFKIQASRSNILVKKKDPA
jgi:hypothetical protein